MKLGFEETQLAYDSGSQSARAWTERWVKDQLYCPNCGNQKLNPLPANSPVADFFCTSCNDEYELKAQKSGFGHKVLDGAYSKKCERLSADNNPSLVLMNYDLKKLSVVNLLVIPKQFFVREIIEERKPLASTSRRPGWIGSLILLSKIPNTGKIFIIRNGEIQPKESVLAEWKKTLFLRSESMKARGWLLEVMKCIEKLGRREFQLEDVYAFENHLSQIYPENRNIRPKIRQQLQFLRDRGGQV